MTLTELEQHFKARNFKPLQELYKQHNGRTFSESCTPCLVQAKKVLQNIIKAQPVVKEVIINETPKTDGHKPKQPRARKKRK
jgi:phosphatidate phosphatase APP1